MNWILFAIIVILQGLDVYTTHQALAKAGNMEANKIMARLMSLLGVLPALILTKSIFCTVLVWAVLYVPSLYLSVALGVIAVGYSFVVINNFRRL